MRASGSRDGLLACSGAAGLGRFQRQAAEIGFTCELCALGAFGWWKFAGRVDLFLELVEKSFAAGRGSRGSVFCVGPRCVRTDASKLGAEGFRHAAAKLRSETWLAADLDCEPSRQAWGTQATIALPCDWIGLTLVAVSATGVASARVARVYR